LIIFAWLTIQRLIRGKNRPVMNILRLITCVTAFCLISSVSLAQKDFIKDA